MEVEYIEPNDWNAPNVTATSNSFNCDIDALYKQSMLYLVTEKGHSKKELDSLNITNMPYPNQGLLLLIYKPW
jgi:hypothetical protein